MPAGCNGKDAMAKIKALLTDPDSTARLVLKEIEPPEPLPNQALVRVEAISLNRGEVVRALGADKPYVPGWDLAGTVEQAAADGSGPKTGARVVGLLRTGAWAERVAVPSGNLAELPAGVDVETASTLPVAGLTALAAVDKAGALLARKVLVTGASGGVGDFAVQLARLSGAEVVGAVRQPDHAAFVRRLGAVEVVAGEDLAQAAQFGPYHFIADAVGSKILVQALAMLAPRGIAVTYAGATAMTPADIPGLRASPGASLYFLFIFQERMADPAGPGLSRLASLISQGQLHPSIEVRAAWTDAAEVALRLKERRFCGKAVLTLNK